MCRCASIRAPVMNHVKGLKKQTSHHHVSKIDTKEFMFSREEILNIEY